MKELLTDNLSLISQLEAVQGIAPLHMLGAARPRLREVSSLPTWCYCFLGYMAARTSDPVTRDQLAYDHLLIKEAQCHGGLGWLDYDKVFRQQIAADSLEYTDPRTAGNHYPRPAISKADSVLYTVQGS